MSIHYPVGIGPDQVPLNNMFGDLARMPLEDMQALLQQTITARQQALGLGANRDLRNTVYEKGVPQDIYATGMTVGFARGGPDGLAIGVLGTGNNLYGVLIVNSQWNDASGGAGMRRVFIRGGRTFTQSFSSATAWGSWIEAFTTQNAVGTVAQSSGVITGAIIERGSNSNGEYTRWADGTQICTHVSPALRTCSTQAASGGFYFASVSDTFIFPAAFAADPRVHPHTTGQVNYFSWGVNNSSPSPTNSGSLIICSGLNGAQAYLGYTAVGRWFN